MKTSNHKPRGMLRSIALALAAVLIGAVVIVGAPMASSLKASASTVGGLFVPLQQRIYDTRTNTYAGNTASQLATGKWYTVKVAGVGSAPTAGISAVQVSLTEVNAKTSGSLKADATGVASPNSSVPALIWDSGKETNAATIPVGSDGNFQIYVNAVTDIAIDLQGYYTAGTTAAGGYVPGADHKVLGSSSTSYAQGQSVTLQVAGTDEVPLDASAVMLSVLVIPTNSTAGNLQVYPAGTPPSTPWLLNWDSRENSVFTSAVGLNSSGKVTIAVASGAAALQVAVQGYFTRVSDASGPGSLTVQRARPIDTRSSVPLAAGETRVFQVAGKGGLPDASSGIAAVAANLVIYPGSTPSSSGSVLTSADDANENFWTQFYYPGEEVSSFAITSLGSDGGIKIHNSGSTAVDVLLDVQGWFSGTLPASIVCPTSFARDSWTVALPSDDIGCTVKAPRASSSVDGVDIYVDSDLYDSEDLSTDGLTTIDTYIPAEGGQHSVNVVLTHGGVEGSVKSTYSFGLGDWSTHSLILGPDDDSHTSLTPTLSVESLDDQFGQDAQAQFVISTHQDLSQPVYQSGLGATEITVPEGILANGVTYYWKAVVSGKAGGRESISTLGSDTSSFVASVETGVEWVVSSTDTLGDAIDRATATQSAAAVADSLSDMATQSSAGDAVDFPGFDQIASSEVSDLTGSAAKALEDGQPLPEDVQSFPLDPSSNAVPTDDDDGSGANLSSFTQTKKPAVNLVSLSSGKGLIQLAGQYYGSGKRAYEQDNWLRRGVSSNGGIKWTDKYHMTWITDPGAKTSKLTYSTLYFPNAGNIKSVQYESHVHLTSAAAGGFGYTSSRKNQTWVKYVKSTRPMNGKTIYWGTTLKGQIFEYTYSDREYTLKAACHTSDNVCIFK